MSQQKSNQNLMEINPNPSKKTLNIRLIEIGATITIFGIDGRLILEHKLEDNGTNYSINLEPGEYLIRAFNPYNRRIELKKATIL